VIIDKPWSFNDDQSITIGERVYNVHASILMAEKLQVKKLALDDLYIEYPSPCYNTFRDFVAHIKLVNDADLSYPILLNENGAIIDGKHRYRGKGKLAKRIAIVYGKQGLTSKASLVYLYLLSTVCHNRRLIAKDCAQPRR